MASLRDEITKTIRRLSSRSTQADKPLGRQSGDTTVLATDPREGRHFGAYRILRRLGIGGMGHVYLAQDTRLGRHAALKFLSPKLKSNPEMMARLQQEARTASSLNHPNILTIYDIDEAEGEPFIASEFVDGVTLRQVLERGPMAAATALDLAIQIASALKPAHEAGVIHRDLKPGNVMLRPDGLVKVIDFGLAKFTAQGHIAPLYEALSDPGAVAGTVQYMSPEQARGDEVDHRTDLWSLGVMLYEMVSHRKPFDGETESHIIVAILDQRPHELRTGSGLPSGLARIVDKALSKSPDKRYQTADEMLSALKLLELSTHSRPSRVLVSALTMRRKKTARRVWLALLGCLLLLGVAIWWPYQGREMLMGPDWFAPNNHTQITSRGDVDIASISPDGSRVAYTTNKNGQVQLHELNLVTDRETEWPPSTGRTLGLTYAADSAAVYLTLHDQREWGRLYRAKDDSSDLTFVLDDIDGPIAFSPDGSEFAFRRRFDDKRTNREAIVIAKVSDTGDQRILLTKYNTLVGPRIAWSSAGLMAVNLLKKNLTGDYRPTVLVFLPNGKELKEYTAPPLLRLSGPAWLNARSMLIFSGLEPGSDESGSTIVELATRPGHFRFIGSPLLASQSMTVSGDSGKIAAVLSVRKSSLWVANSANLDIPEAWVAGDSFDSFTWLTDDSIVHPSPRGGDVALWAIQRGGVARFLPQPDGCMRREPVAVPGRHLLVFSSNCGANANDSNLWLLNQDDGSLIKLTEHPHSDEWPTVAPDADTVIYNSWPNNSPALLKLSLRTRRSSQFTPLQARNAAISPDGQHVACQIRENYDGQWRVALLSIRDGSIEKDNLPLPVDSGSKLRWSPDGAALDYVNPHDSSNLCRYVVNNSGVQIITHLHGPPISDFAWNSRGTQLAWVSSDVRRDVIIYNRGTEK